MNVGRMWGECGEECEDECGDQCGDSFTVVFPQWFCHFCAKSEWREMRARELVPVHFE